jgi:hypothetical protein
MSDDGLTRRDVLVAAGAVGAVGAAAVGAAGVIGLVGGAAAPAETLVAPQVTDVPADDPAASAWEAAPELVVSLLPQQVAPPFLDQAGVAELRVRALHGDGLVAFRLAWDDDELDDLDGVRRYHDAVAVMLPTAPGANPPPITMGAPGNPVHILQWRATWQRDLTGKTGVDQIYPRVVHDVMPDDILPPETAKLYWVGRAAGNPLSLRTRTTPVEQAVAEGFGTTTHLDDVSARGTGIHDGTGWAVTMAIPAVRTRAGEPLEPGRPWHAAFAVWLGHQENRGGRKHYANWVPFQLESAA